MYILFVILSGLRTCVLWDPLISRHIILKNPISSCDNCVLRALFYNVISASIGANLHNMVAIK